MLRPGMLKISVKLTRTHMMTVLPSFSTRLGLLLMIDFYHTSSRDPVVQYFDQHRTGHFSESFPFKEKQTSRDLTFQSKAKCVSTQRFSKGVSARLNGRER